MYSSQDADLIIDVTGYVPAGSAITTQAPARVADTRVDGATVDGVAVGGGRIRAGQFREIQVAGRAGVPAGAGAVVANVTAARGAGVGFFTVYPCGERPTASTLNYTSGTPIANASILTLSESGSVCVYSSQDADLIIDITGYVDANATVG